MAIRRGGSRSNSRQITIEILGDDRQARRAFEAAQKASQNFARETQRSLEQAGSGAERFARGFKQGFDAAERSLANFGRRLGQNVRSDLESLARWGRNAVLAIGGVVTAIGGLALKGGIDRALNIEQAQAKLRGLGHDAQAVETIMQSALDAVRGTAFGLDEAATIAATAVAAGVEPGRELTRVLSLIGDTATIAGVPLSEMGQIFGQVLANGRAMTQELNRLQDRGIPILQWLADEFGTTTVAMRQMVAEGVVDSQTYLRAIENNIAGAALESGETTRGAFANMRAAMSRFGEAMVREIFPVAKQVFEGIGQGFDTITARLRPFVAEFSRSDFFRGLIEGVQRIPELFDRAVEAIINAWNATEGLRTAFGNLVAGGAAIIQFVINLNNWLGGLPAILAGIAAALALLYAHPVIAGLGAVAAIIGGFTQKSREAEAAIRDLRRAIEEAERTGDSTGLYQEIAEDLADIVGGTDELIAALDAIGIRLDQAVGFVLGEPDDIEAVVRALGNYRTAISEIEDDVFNEDYLEMVATLSLVEEAFGTVIPRFGEAQEQAISLAEALAEAERAANFQPRFEGMRFVRDLAGESTEAWYNNAAAIEENQLRLEAMDQAIAELAQTWGNELNREFQNFINIFEQAPELDLTQIVKTDDQGNEQVLAEGIDALITNAENRIDQAERWLEGLQTLQEAGLTNLLEEFRARGVEGLADLEDVTADIDAGGARAFELDRMLGEAREAGTSVTGEMGLAMAAEAVTLYAQAEEIGEGVVEALARGASGAQVSIDMDITASARMRASGRLQPGTGSSGVGFGVTPRATGGRVDPFEAYLVGDGGRTEVLQMGARGGFIHPSVESFLGSMVPQMAGGGGGGGFTWTGDLIVQAPGGSAEEIGRFAIRQLDRELGVFQRGMNRPL